MKSINKSRVLLIAVMILSTRVCANSHDVRNDADTYCKLYNPSSWHVLGEKPTLYEIYNYIVTRQKSELKNSNFKDVLGKSDNSNFDRFHSSTKKNIGNILGEDWHCQYFDEFYRPARNVISISLQGLKKIHIDPNAQDVIVVSVSQSGEILIGNAPLVSNESSLIKKAILLKLGNRDRLTTHFVLYSDSGADGSLLTRILTVMTELGVKDLSLVDY